MKLKINMKGLCQLQMIEANNWLRPLLPSQVRKRRHGGFGNLPGFTQLQLNQNLEQSTGGLFLIILPLGCVLIQRGAEGEGMQSKPAEMQASRILTSF